MYRILVADIGATNSRFAVFTAEVSPSGDALLQLMHAHWLKGAEYPSFGQAVSALRECGPFSSTDPYDMAVLALAGPIEGDCCRITNLSWRIERQEAAEALNALRVVLINDFEAQGCACLIPDLTEKIVIQSGTPVPDAPAAVIGAGTGLGKALLVPGPPASLPSVPEAVPAKGMTKAFSRTDLEAVRSIRLLPSEGGQADFPFIDMEECDFGAFLRREGGWKQVTGDAVISGSGLGHLYAFMTGFRLPDEEVPAETTARRPDVLARYARLYGRACRNYVLETLALGGLYITGGMALRLPVLTHPEFLNEFRNSAVLSHLMENVPVYHLQEHQAGLWGAAFGGLLRLPGIG